MALSNSILAYGDCREFLDRAMDDSVGARLPFKNEDTATRWRMRCNQFRQLDRDQNRIVYDLGHKMHGHSDYDVLTLMIRYSTDAVWVYAVKIQIDTELIEPLSTVPQITAEEQKYLEDHSDGNETTSGDVS